MESDEFNYTFKRCSITLTRNDGPLGNWYIRVRGPDGCYLYDGWWADSAGKPLKDALYEAKVGALLLPKSPPMDPQRARELEAAKAHVAEQARAVAPAVLEAACGVGVLEEKSK